MSHITRIIITIFLLRKGQHYKQNQIIVLKYCEFNIVVGIYRRYNFSASICFVAISQGKSS